MKGIFKKHTLSNQLIRMVIITFLPVNLLAVLVCGFILVQASGQVRESYQRELDTVMNQMQEDLMEAEEAFSDFLLDYMSELMLVNVSSPTVNYNMITDLSDDFEKCGGDGLYYLYDKKEDRIYLRYSRGVYAIELVEEMKAALLEQCRTLEENGEDSPGEWSMQALTGEYFLTRQYNYTNYRIGFLLDMERFLENKGQSDLWRDNRVYLKTQDEVYTYREGYLKLSNRNARKYTLKKGILNHDVCWENTNPNITIAIEMVSRDFRGGVPLAYWVLLFVSVCSALLAVGMWRALKRNVVTALHLLRDAMEELEKENLSFRIEQWDETQAEEFCFLYERFNHMAQEVELSREKDIRMYQVRLDNLRLQVNPHMLLNSFNMIYCLAQSKNYDCIQRYSLLLVEYFRYALKDTGQLVPLSREMEFVETYIGIQKIRFPGAISSVYNIQEGCGDAMIPPLLVENFVENAMKYALVSGAAIEVLINIRRENNRLFLSICDTGRGIKPEILECLQKGEIYVDNMGREHIGVWNCRRRLEIFYHGDATLKLISDLGVGTQVWLELPYWTEESVAQGKENLL